VKLRRRGLAAVPKLAAPVCFPGVNEFCWEVVAQELRTPALRTAIKRLVFSFEFPFTGRFCYSTTYLFSSRS